MKLRNKKTGVILEAARSSAAFKDKFRIYDELNDNYYTYDSLAALNEDWEDYEEPEEYNYIRSDGVIACSAIHDETTIQMKIIGNYFETYEEVEKAVEKLKALKRLKDKGFRFIGKTYETDKRFGSAFYELDEETYSEDVVDDIDLLFGGEK